MRNFAAIAIDHHYSYEKKGGVNNKFQIKPNITKKDYDFIRILSNWNGGAINIYTPFILLVDELGNTLNATDVIGNSSLSCKFILPQASLFSTLRDMKEHEQMAVQTQSYELLSQPAVSHTKSTGTPLDHWHRVLVGLHFADKEELKRRLIMNYAEHTLCPKHEETTMEYIQRHAQRIPLQKTQKGGVINTPNVTSRKRQRELQRENEKWQVGKKPPAVTKKLSPQEKLLKDWDDVMTGVKLPDGADIDDLMNELMSLKQFGFDENEHETLKMMGEGRTGKRKRLAAPKQLGDWITIEIDAKKQLVSCNCERCNSYGKCGWVAVLEVLQFNAIPPIHCRTVDDGFGWSTHVRRAREALKKIILDV